MSFEQVFDYDKDSLIFNDGREDVDNPVQKGTYYYLMSKTDGGMRPLPFSCKVSYYEPLSHPTKEWRQARGNFLYVFRKAIVEEW